MTESIDVVGQVADSLLRLEMELRQLGAWEAERPPVEAFQSTQPFCIDTLEFTQWLQFVFIERMKVIVENENPLPSVSGMAPMAEEHFRGRAESGQSLIRELETIDRLLSDG
ncbi:MULTISPECIES: YqcC family protein [Marinobacter]|uniref:YqcC family protein n=1 Tax=Marinobacter suaedae TaxID=3057675 RepID=A0ABT8W0V2_9GAMM|nr:MULTISPECIES: YqcC family protein [unclassified Marinobacter]MBZ2169900.1 YqcC family protein [Marinobacter sp. F4216]MDO3721880.1 YqcC family protein [Marinobacter sp. chi1]